METTSAPWELSTFYKNELWCASSAGSIITIWIIAMIWMLWWLRLSRLLGTTLNRSLEPRPELTAAHGLLSTVHLIRWNISPKLLFKVKLLTFRWSSLTFKICIVHYYAVEADFSFLDLLDNLHLNSSHLKFALLFRINIHFLYKVLPTEPWLLWKQTWISPGCMELFFWSSSCRSCIRRESLEGGSFMDRRSIPQVTALAI